jgi:hypothetical protein
MCSMIHSFVSERMSRTSQPDLSKQPIGVSSSQHPQLLFVWFDSAHHNSQRRLAEEPGTKADGSSMDNKAQ